MKTTNKLLSLTAFAAAAMSFAIPAIADTLTWNGADGDSAAWTEDNNWLDGTGASTEWVGGSDAYFGTDGNKNVTISNDIVAGTVTIEDEYTFTLEEGASLTTTELLLDDVLTIQGSGTVKFSSHVYVGKTSGCEGSIEIYGGKTTFSGYLYVGCTDATGTITIYGGENSFASVYIGYEGGGSGTIEITEGTNNFTGLLEIGAYGTTSEGTLKISGGNNNFSTGFAYIGWQGHGTIEITGGTTSFDGTELYLGCAADAIGEMTISGGNTTFGTNTTIGNNGTGKMTISGDDTVVNFGVLYVGRETGSSGTLKITGGTTTFVSTYSQYIGYNGSGLVEIGGNDTVVNFGVLYVGYGYNNKAGSGEVTISGGTVTIAGYTYLGYRYSSTGTMTITGGDVMFSRAVYIGGGGSLAGTGTMTIAGGKTTFSSGLYIGYGNNSATIGKLTITDGETICLGDVYINYRESSTGSMTIDGGINSFSGTVYVGYGNTGTLDISDGTTVFLGAINIGRDYNGSSYIGTVTITGGNTTFSGTITIANNDSSLSIGSQGASGTATVYLEKQIGTATNGSVVISDNAKIILGSTFLTGEEVVVIEANSITLGTELLSNSISGGVLDTIANTYFFAEGYDLTWHYDGAGTLYVTATEAAPEPSMFGMLLGLGALGLVATRRRRRA